MSCAPKTTFDAYQGFTAHTRLTDKTETRWPSRLAMLDSLGGQASKHGDMRRAVTAG